MVPKWEKNLLLIKKHTNINIDSIIIDILAGNYQKYDWKKLGGHRNLYRVRIGNYRIVFMVSENEIRIVGVDTRANIYKKF